MTQFERELAQMQAQWEERLSGYLNEYFQEFVDFRNIGHENNDVFYLNDDADYMNGVLHFEYPKPDSIGYNKEVMYHSDEIDKFLQGFSITQVTEVHIDG